MRIIVGVILTITGLIVVYRNRFRIISSLISISFLRKLLIMISMNIPALKNKLFQMTFSRSA